jgi:hypothetical protein
MRPGRSNYYCPVCDINVEMPTGNHHKCEKCGGVLRAGKVGGGLSARSISSDAQARRRANMEAYKQRRAEKFGGSLCRTT